MEKVWIVADSIVSPLGLTGDENYLQVKSGNTGIKATSFESIDSTTPLGVCTLTIESAHTRFEQLCIQALDRLVDSTIIPLKDTLFILSTTKGNIAELENPADSQKRVDLHAASNYLQQRYGFKKSMVVSNACISGVLAIAVAKRYLQAGLFQHAIILGADVLSTFVISGFNSLQALSADLCRPFDVNRKGINLGEAAAALLITTIPDYYNKISATPVEVSGAAFTNDANHISGPSRTGRELAMAIDLALQNSLLMPSAVDFISAHGTATLYNDEMEAKAFSLAGLSKVPLHSLKGYYGHTLGAAGVLESALLIRSLIQQETLPTLGFEQLGVSEEINICCNVEKRKMKHVLKMASGFGGCNAAMIFRLHD